MKKEPDASDSAKARELHLHSVGGYAWMGIVYIGGAKQVEIEPMASIEAVERKAAERFGDGLKPIVWAQDDGTILSEG